MKQELIDMLLEHYGELMQERDTIGVHNWSKRDEIIRKMHSIETLLNLTHKNQTTIDAIAEIVRKSSIK